MLLLSAGAHEVLRFIPALTVSPAETEEGLAILEAAIDAVARKRNLTA